MPGSCARALDPRPHPSPRKTGEAPDRRRALDQGILLSPRKTGAGFRVDGRVKLSTLRLTLRQHPPATLNMVHAILGLRARAELAAERIPTIACGMTGAWPTGVKKSLTGAQKHQRRAWPPGLDPA